MLKIKNTSTQSFDIQLMTESGSKHYWITPGKSIAVPDSYLTDQVRLMQKRRILNLTNIG